MVALLTWLGLALIIVGIILLFTLVGFIPGSALIVIGVILLLLSGAVTAFSSITDAISDLLSSGTNFFSSPTIILLVIGAGVLLFFAVRDRSKGKDTRKRGK